MNNETDSVLQEYFLNIGEVSVVNTPVIMNCFGLGSCIGLFLYDRILKIGAGAHIMLPKLMMYNLPISKFCYADFAIEEMITQMVKLGSSGRGLRAKMVGGAHLFSGEFMNVGSKNTDFIIAELQKRIIHIAALEVGGAKSRSARFNTKTGQVEVAVSVKEKYIV